MNMIHSFAAPLDLLQVFVRGGVQLGKPPTTCPIHISASSGSVGMPFARRVAALKGW
ncbi:MAG: hypothetical protein ACREIC_33905 [Limisphaerales bacterium]